VSSIRSCSATSSQRSVSVGPQELLHSSTFFTLTISILITQIRHPPAKRPRALIDLAAFRFPIFVIFIVGLFLAFIGLYVPYFYIVTYAERLLNTNDSLSFNFLVVLNAASLFGRIIPGILADKLGSINVMIIFTIASSILAYAWIAIHDLLGLIVFCVLYGFCSGAVISLPTTVFASFVPDLQLIGTRMGMSFGFGGLGVLIGNPIDGSILNIPENKFTGGIVFCASTLLAGGLAFVIVRILKADSRKSWKM